MPNSYGQVISLKEISIDDFQVVRINTAVFKVVLFFMVVSDDKRIHFLSRFLFLQKFDITCFCEIMKMLDFSSIGLCSAEPP